MKSKLITLLFLLIAIVVGIYLYARYINTKGFLVKEKAITYKELPKDYDGLKIVQFSDIHYGRTIEKDDLEKIVKEINKLNADIIVFTGDLFDKEKITNEEKEYMTKTLKKINAKLFKFGVIGDYDEKYLNIYKDILDNSDFILLNNESKLVYNNSSTPINIVGLTNTSNIKELYNNDAFTITLMHQPDMIKQIPKSNLVLAGHSLGGQIKIPFVDGIIKIDGANTYINNYYKVNNIDMYISNGLGTQKYSVRLFNKPSITLYRLYH